MGLTVSNSPGPQVPQPTTDAADVAGPDASAPVPLPAEPPKLPPDPQSEAKAEIASRHYATDNKSHLDMRSKILQDQLAAKIWKAPPPGSEDEKAGPVLYKDTGTLYAGPNDPKLTTIADKAKVAGDGTKLPPPTTLKEFAYDKVAEKVLDTVKGMKPDLKREVNPKLSAEQEALHDVAAGMKKYQEYMQYAKTTAAMLKLAPNNNALKQALIKNLGDLDGLAGQLEKGASVLGKVGKYANLAKDALGTTQAVRDLIANTPKDFSDRKAVGKFADSLQKTSDSAQVWFERGKDALIAAGKSGAGVAFSYFTGMISIGVDGLKAGVGNVNAYFDKMQERMKIIENGGVKPKDLQPPDPPPPIKTYAQLRMEERQEKVSKVYNVVSNQFTEAADGVKKAFQARHKEVGEKFEKEVLPKLYLQNRDQFMKQLKYEVNHPQMYERGAAASANSSQLLRTMQENGSKPNARQIQEEMSALKVHYGSPDGKTIIPMPVEKLLKQYRPELDKFYAKHGFGEDALEKEYIAHGLTQQNKDQVFRQMIKEAGLDNF